MGPREYFHPPISFAHPIQRTVKAGALLVAGTIARQDHDDAGIAVEIQRVLKHRQLQEPVRHVLLASGGIASVEELHLHAHRLHSVPQLAHFRRH